MVAPTSQTKLRQVIAFLRSFAPQQWGQLLFVFGALSLFCAPFASWSPPFPLPRQPWEVPNPFFEQIPPFSAEASILAWKAWHRFLLVPQLLIFVAGLFALAFSFAPTGFIGRRRWSWVYATCLLALGVIWVRLFLWAAQSGSVLETTGQRMSRFLSAVPDLAMAMGAGLQVFAAGLFLLGTGLRRARRGKVSLPVRFREIPANQMEPLSQEGVAAEVTTFSLIVLASVGFFLLLSRLLVVFDVSSSSFELSRWGSFLLWSLTFLPAGVPILCGLALRGRAWKGELAGMFRLGSPRDYGVALLIPLLALAIPQLLVYVLSRITWELEQFFGAQPLSFDAFYAPSWFELSAFPPALLEEMAWRAYLLPLMIRLVGVRRGLFVVALLWGAWHFPSDVVVSTGTFQVLGAVAGRLVFATVYSVALSWLYLRSRSALPPGLMHGMLNFLWYWTAFHFPYSGELVGWAQLAVWGAAGYLLFRYWPPQGSDTDPHFSP